MVTGASRGIGKASAIALARAGFDLIITARTVQPGGSPWPGSLAETAADIESAGGAAHQIAMDLLDQDRVLEVADQVQTLAGPIDVLLNNAIYVSDTGQPLTLDTDLADMEKRMFGNVTAQILLTLPIARHMVANGSGAILNMTSAAGYAKPFALPGKGGWNFPYSISKGAFHRIAPQLQFEYGDQGLQARNLQPGMVSTERLKARMGETAIIANAGVETSVVGRAVAHVATHIDDFDPLATIQLQDVAVALGLIDKPASL